MIGQQFPTGPMVTTTGMPSRSWYNTLNTIAAGVVESSTFATLPLNPMVGQLRVVTDSTTATWGAVIAGGGANVVLAWFNGTDFTVVGI